MGPGFPGGIAKKFFKNLTGEEILVSEVLANQLGLKSGDKLRLMTAGGLTIFHCRDFYDYRTEGGRSGWTPFTLTLNDPESTG
jgi:hypothetical protein